MGQPEPVILAQECRNAHVNCFVTDPGVPHPGHLALGAHFDQGLIVFSTPDHVAVHEGQIHFREFHI